MRVESFTVRRDCRTFHSQSVSSGSNDNSRCRDNVRCDRRYLDHFSFSGTLIFAHLHDNAFSFGWHCRSQEESATKEITIDSETRLHWNARLILARETVRVDGGANRECDGQTQCRNRQIRWDAEESHRKDGERKVGIIKLNAKKASINSMATISQELPLCLRRRHLSYQQARGLSQFPQSEDSQQACVTLCE